MKREIRKEVNYMSKRTATVDHEAPPKYEFAGHWQINLKGWSLVRLLAGGSIIFGLSFILGLTIRGLLRGYFEGQVSLGGGFFPILIILGVFVAFIILHEGIHGLMFQVLVVSPVSASSWSEGSFPWRSIQLPEHLFREINISRLSWPHF